MPRVHSWRQPKRVSHMPSSSLKNLLRSTTLTGGETYFAYERRLGREVLIPWLERRVDLIGASVADFGCHQGGVLDAFRGDGRVACGVGFDLNEANLKATPFLEDERFHLEHRDLLTLDQDNRFFDLIVLCDVLEHVPQVERMMRVVFQRLRPRGQALVTFPPYWSPFGGHQQLASNATRLLPYFHYLPESVVLGLARIEDNDYMRAEDAVSDMRAVRRTRLTIARAERAFSEAGLEFLDRQLYALRPEYSVRYGVTPLRIRGLAAARVLREILVMGAYYLLRRPK